MTRDEFSAFLLEHFDSIKWSTSQLHIVKCKKGDTMIVSGEEESEVYVDFGIHVIMKLDKDEMIEYIRQYYPAFCIKTVKMLH